MSDYVSGDERAPSSAQGGGIANSGSSSGGSSGSNPGECADDLKHIIPPPVADCPDAVPQQLDPCDVKDGAVCTWQVGMGPSAGFELLACYLHDGEKTWFGSGTSDGEAGGIHNELCPHTAVEANANCDGHVDQLCKYDTEICLCDSATTTWTCKPGYGKISMGGLQRIERLCVPFDETKQVKDLTSAEARDWCRWSVDPLGQGVDPSRLAPAAPPYNTENYSAGDVAGDVCLPTLPVDACVANLAVAPNCDATLGELDECLETLYGRARVADGCETLLGNPSCAGVLVMRVPNGDRCPLPFP